ncbi:FAD-dependent monooxygenase [Pseudonocardia sp. GCM10023141]|uniref:FAD-dependent monooxygenase n=1 Tax=Pseudonocardia sp. GCM10023141 TaxID=3252653 RepID=UPI003605ED10
MDGDVDTDVVVVGAGPVGLLLAAELTQAGASPVVVERRASPPGRQRARGVGPLAAEALARRGLAGAIAQHHPDGAERKARDHGSEKDHFAWLHKIDPTRQDEPERRGVLIAQPDLEAVLADHAARLGVVIDRGAAVTALQDDGSAVTLTIESDGAPRRIRARYVVGCDGGSSTVRKLAGFAFPGTEPIMVGRRATVAVHGPRPLPPPGRTDRGLLMLAPDTVGTFEFDELHLPADRRSPVTAEELRDSVRRTGGVDVVLGEVREALRFTDAAFQASTYRRGRVLLAGDAAHVHSPTGGQGLNLGLLDAVNLGWKLARQVRGTAPDGLLDTYSAERHPAGAAVLHNTRAQSALMRPGPHTDALRDIVSDLMDIDEVNRYFGRLLSGLDTRYAVADAVPTDHPLVGKLAPDLELTTTSGVRRHLSEHTTEGHAVLITPSADRARSAADGLRVISATPTRPDLTEALIRADGAIVWAAGPHHPADGVRLREAITTWFG